MEMRYMDIVRNSLSNAWKYKFLWLFGFFVAAADGSGNSRLWLHDFDKRDWGGHFGHLGPIHISPIIIVYILLAMFAMWIIFWILSVISEGALIHGISRKELNRKVDFSGCWSTGLNKFFRLLGIVFLATLAIIFSILFLAMFIVPSYFASVAIGILATIIALPILLAVILITVCIEGWSIRYAVLHDERWLDAIAKGWSLFKDNIGKTLGVAFSSFFSQFVLGSLLIIGALVLAIPFILVGIANLWLGLVPGLMAGFIIVILVSAFFGTFASSVWTIGFMKLTGLYAQPAAAVPGTTPAAPDSGGDYTI